MDPAADPRFSFAKFGTTNANCPISYSVALSAGNTAMMTTVFNQLVIGDSYVILNTGWKLIKADYKFTITATAEGGASITAQEWTL